MAINVNFESFSETSEWSLIVRHLEEIKKDYMHDMVAAGSVGDVNKMISLAGKCAMIDEMIGLPSYLSGAYRSPRYANDKERQ